MLCWEPYSARVAFRIDTAAKQILNMIDQLQLTESK
jgi:hypothetical protein